MEKVKVSKEVAHAIEEAKRLGVGHNGEARMVELHVTGPNSWLDHCKPLNNMDLDKFIRTLYIGYEVETTPEEKVQEWIQKHHNCYNEREAVRQVLDILNIKIYGVNE